MAAGTGIATRELVRALPGAAVVATDLNPAMVSWARERVPGATWSVADAQHLDLAPASFDLVVCQFGVMFFPDRRQAYAEAARVLVPGGTLLFAVWDAVELSPFPHALMQSLAAMLPEDPPSFVVRVPHGYAEVGRIREDLEAAGLVVDAVDRVVLDGRAASAGTLAEGFCLGSPLRFELAERGDLAELQQAVAEQMTLRLGPGLVEGDLAALVVLAHVPS